MPQIQFWKTLLQALQRGQSVFLALVVGHTKGSPGTTGAKLLVTSEGTIAGTVGGGIMEHRIIERATQVLQGGSFRPEIQTLVHCQEGTGQKSGLICAGSQTNLYYLCSPTSDATLMDQLAVLLGQDNPAILWISPAEMAIRPGSVSLRQPIIHLTYSAEAWLYQEQLFNRRRLAIFGGGHCALALSRVMEDLNYAVCVFDTRPNLKPCQQNASVPLQILEDYKTAGETLSYPEITCVAVMTTEVCTDVRALLGVVRRPFPYIGVMGSPAKLSTIWAHLQQAGVSTDDLANLYAPIGLPLNSHTPEEIAIAVAAQILQERDRWEFWRQDRGDALAQAI